MQDTPLKGEEETSCVTPLPAYRNIAFTERRRALRRCSRFCRGMITPKKKHSETPEGRPKLNNDGEFSVNKVQIMTSNFLLHIFGILPPNNATPFIRFLYKIFQTLIFTLLIFSMLGQLMAVYVNWGDIPLISIIVSHMSGMILASISCAYFLHSKDKFMSLIDLLRTQFVSRMKSKYIELIHTAERQVKGFLILSVIISAECAAIWVAKPIIKIYNYERNNATTEAHDFERFIFVIWAPFEIYDSPQFELIMVSQMFASTFSGLMLFAVDILFLSLMSHAAAQFKVLCAMLNDMHENVSEVELNRTKQMFPLQDIADFNLMNDPVTSADDITCYELGSGNSGSRNSEMAVLENCHVNKDPFQLYLAECIKHHQAIIEFVDHLNKIVSLVTFLKVLNFPLLLCMTGFQMMQSEKVQLAFYSTEWYSQTAGYKSLLPLAIMRASRPVTVKAGVFFDMSFLTLASLVNASYRFMTMLIQLNDS
ncbi:uncharacterized protein LOC111873350 isoform X2 [Cryptotermes secundus]|uniref:uncharacterized protein LOC111873350 isoform X2 n=1 Tax=Cryptotermes secundus TaxID=105785 RepID=UPI000CD7D253|nr:uncharacterized protein LOC111873350 isoform X2 [Cryptotermes secundus]